MSINLTISADSVEEFDALLSRFSRFNETALGAVMPELRGAAAEPAPKGKRTSSKTSGTASEPTGSSTTSGPEPTQNPDGTTIPPIHTPEPQPTPGGTDAPPAESIPPNQAAVDPFAPATDATAGAAAGGAAATPSTSVAATPAATAGTTATTASGSEVTIQNLKDAMADLLKAKSASFAMQTLEAATGCKSLTTGSPSVVEKSKEDPGIMQRTLDALVAAKG